MGSSSVGEFLLSNRFLGWMLLLLFGVFSTCTLYMVSVLEETRKHDDMSLVIPQTRVGMHIESVPILAERNKTWTRPFVHVVNTRFMQHQGQLIHLGRARLLLFEAFCFQTIVRQTVWRSYNEQESPPFLWIIKTDPELDESILNDLIDMISPFPFIYLVASNVNYGVGIHPGGWRDGQAGKDLFQSTIFTGDMEWLRQAYEVRETRAVLETRLDADDGLHVRYLETIQADAEKKLQTPEHLRSSQTCKWRYWCSLNTMEWSPNPVFVNDSAKGDHGFFVPRRSPHACVTPGLTLGMAVGETEHSVPRYPHQELFKRLRMNKNHPDCGDEKCLRMINDPLLASIRSRSPTSAGMKNVATREKEAALLEKHAVSIKAKEVEAVLQSCFRVNMTMVSIVNTYLQTHLSLIVEDNLKGQCTHGHSCKNATKDALKHLLHVAKKKEP